MCGIAGVLLPPDAELAAPVARMCESLRPRGPDAAGEWFDRARGVGLGHRRLSIIDLDARANQPLGRDGDGLRIVFNGEIYNYRELGRELEQQGVRLRTTSDTEVILELYRRLGPAAFPRLRGMFALAIWDPARDALVLARDPYGIKPLYVARTARGVLFASQVKALMATGLVSAAPDNAGVAGFHLWGSVPEPFTVHRDVTAATPGAVTLLGRDGSARVERFADVAAAWAVSSPPPQDVAARVRAALASTVEAHLVADVPVAVLLSGGVDSGVIAALMAERGQSVEGVTISFATFEGGPNDEVPRAREIAGAYGLRHTVRRVEREEFEADTAAILQAMDQPSIDGVNTWFAAKAIAERGYKVALSGVGGDELFCGYDSFRSVPRLRRLARLSRLAGPAADPALAAAARLTGKPKLAGLARFGATLEGAYQLRRGVLAPNELPRVMSREAAREGLERLAAEAGGSATGAATETGAVAVLESTRYLRNQLLRDSDWASMAHGLELRTPLVDWRLLQDLAPLAPHFLDGAGKRLMAQSPARPLPAAVVEHRKTGFSLPIGAWLAEGAVSPPDAPQQPWARRWAGVVAAHFGITP